MRRIVIFIPRRKFAFAIAAAVIILVSIAASIIISVSESRNVLSGKIIVIDAGHGGVDGGANNSEIKEKDINLSVALMLRKKLQESGAKVIMTRVEDVDLSNYDYIDRNRYIRDLNERVRIINTSSANMFVSIHTNANRNKPSTRGVIAYFSNSHPHNRYMAYIFQDVFNTYPFEYNGQVYKSHHIPQQGKYYLLQNAKIPGVIVETGFITNSTDLMLLKTHSYHKYLSEAVFQGIVNYFSAIDNLPRKQNNDLFIEEENIINMYEDTTGA